MNEAAASAPTDRRFEAIFFDGVTSKRRIVTLRLGAEGLDIADEGGTLAVWPYDDIRRIDGPGFTLRREAAGAPELARLELRDARLHDDILTRCRFLAGAARPGSTRRIVAWSLAATASVALMIWFGIPMIADRLTPIVPKTFERRLGDAAEAQLRALFPQKICRAETGAAALLGLSARLQAEARLDSVATIEVVDTKVPNALALPGGKIFLFSGLLAKSQGADEIAGVLAHELGHLAHRDALRRLIAIGGTSYLVGLLFGDVTGAGALVFASKELLGAAHSREQEAQADLFAAALMARLGRPATPLGDLLARISGSENSALGLLHDHPLTADRLAALKSADAGASGPELLDAEQWAALKTICD